MTDGPLYDLIVIGAGAAGSTAAFEAVGRGARVALVEHWKVGGTCLNAGCDPTKTLVHIAQVYHDARTAAGLGIVIPQAALDWPAVIAHVEGVIDTIRGGDGDQNIRNAGIDLFKETARLVGPGEVRAGDTTLRGKAIILATGARAATLEVPGLDETGYITNIEAVRLPALPASMAILGAGIIGLEFAQIFARFGVEVTVFSRKPRLLPTYDAEIAAALRAAMERDGVTFRMNVDLQEVSRQGNLKRVAFRQDEEAAHLDVAEILVATGRVPNIENLGLEEVGVMTNPEGIIVDFALETTVPGIWAAGDCVAGAPRFTPMADDMARVAVDNALGHRRALHGRDRLIPTVIFTDPELGQVGMNADQARQAGYRVRTATVPIGALARAAITGKRDGMVTLVADAATGRLLGGTVLAPGGGELLGEIAMAVRLGLPAGAICETLHAYPTFSEGVFWTAWELAKPAEIGLEAAVGVESPREMHPLDAG
jgi:pyruvate/2-oxoglutarate dehydrogenase complex dihydrolipoamide dehydrogenase (E3) component